MKDREWGRGDFRAALAIALFATIPPLVFFLDVPAALLAACGSYYAPTGCSGPCTTGNPRELCCVVVRAKFHPFCNPPCGAEQDCCGHSVAQCCALNPQLPCNPGACTLGSVGKNIAMVIGTPTGDGTTGPGATPKYKSLVPNETVTFVGHVRICAGSPGTSQESWLCAAGRAEVYLDEKPFPFFPDCGNSGLTHIYCDSCPDIPPNTSSAGWRDHLCPVEIGLATAIQDNKWHMLKIVYKNTGPLTSLPNHQACCTGGSYYGATLFLGNEIQIAPRNPLSPSRIPVAGKFQRVNLHGVPVSERSPTGESESDEPQSGFFVDVYNLAPTASFPEVSIPIEGGELSLEFRRDGGVRTAQTSANVLNLPTTYPTDDLLGLGWNSNLSPRAIISRNNQCDPSSDDPPRATFTDSGGATYQYSLETGNQFVPEVYESQSNAAIHATPNFVDTNTLTLTLKHGTEYKYILVGTFYPPDNTQCTSEDYFKLTSIKDRNGNQILYEYATTGFVYPANAMLVSAIKESSHPERRLTFTYDDAVPVANQNGYDWGIRLRTVKDPLGNQFNYFTQFDYTEMEFPDIDIPVYARKRLLLTKVTYPAVQISDSINNGNPTQHYEYTLRVTKGSKIYGQHVGDTGEVIPFERPYCRVLHVGLAGAWQNNDLSTKTVFEYYAACESGEPCAQEFPVAIHPILDVNDEIVFLNQEKQETLTLYRVVPPDGLGFTQFETSRSIACAAQPCSYADFAAQTKVTDPRGKIIDYHWTGVARALDEATEGSLYWNRTGFGTILQRLERSTKDSAVEVFATVKYEYSDDLFGNLTKVVDMSDNQFQYIYSNLQSRESNQPTAKLLSKDYDPLNPPNPLPPSLSTIYEYGVFNKLSAVSDPEGKLTTFTFDAQGKGNRTAVTNQGVSQNRTTTYSYNADGFLASTSDAELRKTNFSPQFTTSGTAWYDKYYTVTTIVDPDAGGLQLKSVKVYDVSGNLRKEIPPEGYVPDTPPRDPEAYATKYEYDALRRLKRVTKPQVLYNGTLASTVAECFYDLRGNLVKKKAARDAAGQEVTSTLYEYDAMSRLVKTTIILDPAGSPTDPTKQIITEREYDYMGLVARETDARGNEVWNTYDTILRLQYKDHMIVIPGQFLREEYQYEYYTSGPSGIERVRPNSGSGAFAYSAGWKPIRVIKPRWFPTDPSPIFATDLAFDEFYRLVQVVNRRDPLPEDPSDWGRNEEGAGQSFKPAEPMEHSVYDDAGKVVTHLVALNNAGGYDYQKTYTFYDDFDRPTATVLDLDGQSVYNPEETPVNVWSDLVPAPDDIVTLTKYDKTDKVTDVSDPEGKVSSKGYDKAGRIADEKGPWVMLSGTSVRPRVTTSYDANGNVVAKRGPYPDGGAASGLLVGYAYDKQNRRLKSMTDLDGNGVLSEASDIVISESYDLLGNVILSTDAEGNQTTSEYDLANRMVILEGPVVFDAVSQTNLQSVTTTIYDMNSNVTEVIYPKGVHTKYEYDKLNRVIVERKAADSTDELRTEKVYDANGNLITLLVFNIVGAQSRTQQTIWTYDPFDRPTMEILPGALARTTAYYRDGKVQIVTNPNLQYVEYDYDRARRTTYTRSKLPGTPNPTIQESRAFFYDKAGNVTEVVDLSTLVAPVSGSAPNKSTYVYDGLYRVTTEKRKSGIVPEYTVTSEYDLRGNRTKLNYPIGTRNLIQVYDPAGRLTSITDSSGNYQTVYGYNKNGKCTWVKWPSTANPVAVTTYIYDALQRLTMISAVKMPASSNIYTATYGYDLSSNILSYNENLNGATRSLNYTYDSQYRLKSEGWAGNSYQYAYDRIGNRLTLARTAPGINYTYTYTYDNYPATPAIDRNELKKVDFNNGSTIQTTNYTYNANGNLSTKVVAGSTTTYTWDGYDRLTQVAGATTFSAIYDYRTRRISKTEGGSTTYFFYDAGLCLREATHPTLGTLKFEFVRGRDLGGGIGGILYENNSANAIRLYFYNNVGHTVALTSNTGAVVDSYKYDAFGNSVQHLGSGTENRLANTKELDAVTGFYNHGFRYYDPVLGRYVSRDPAGLADGPHLYLYVHNNPVVGVDSTGLFSHLFSTGVSDSKGNVTLKAVWDMPPDFQKGFHNSFVPSLAVTAGITAGAGAVAAWGMKAVAGYAAIELVEEAVDRAAGAPVSLVTSVVDPKEILEHAAKRLIRGADDAGGKALALIRGGELPLDDGLRVGDNVALPDNAPLISITSGNPSRIIFENGGRIEVPTGSKGGSVLVDSSAVPQLGRNPTLGGRILAGEQPGVSFVTRAELRNAVSSGGLKGVPKVLDDLPVNGLAPSIDTRINVRGLLPAGRGRFGDGIIGGQALEQGVPLITNDKALGEAVLSLGGTVR